MTDKEIYFKAIKKAELQGFDFKKLKYDLLDRDGKAEGNHNLIGRTVDISMEAVIFSHEFAKAFWGESDICNLCGSKKYTVYDDYLTGDKDITCDNCGANAMDKAEFPDDGSCVRSWQYHLQQMVLEENPILYLEQFL